MINISNRCKTQGHQRQMPLDNTIGLCLCPKEHSAPIAPRDTETEIITKHFQMKCVCMYVCRYVCMHMYTYICNSSLNPN